MAIGHASGGPAARQLRAVFEGGPVGDLSDGQLLGRFAAGGVGSEAAFAVLVDRHAAAAWHACRAVLADRHRAEDAFQATFLVLARRADSLATRGRDSIGPWLRQVARRTARGLRAADRRRLKHERRAAEAASPLLAPAPPPDPEPAAALRAEVDRLPAALRAAVVLCDLEGQTHAEAARRLGWPVGTVKSRQARARGLIRDRLARRGFGPAALPLGLGLDSVPRGLAVAAARAATGHGIPSGLLALAHRTIQAMLWNQIRSAAALTIGLGLVAGASGLAVVGAQDPGPAATPNPPPAAGLARPDAPAPPADGDAPGAEAARPAGQARRGVVRIGVVRPRGTVEPGWVAPGLVQAFPKADVQIRAFQGVAAGLVHHPIVYLPVRGEVGLISVEIAALRNHLLAGGGTLLADAGDSDPARDAEFRRFAAELFPEGRLEPIPAADPLLFPKGGSDLARCRTTPALGDRVGPAELEGIRVDGLWAVVYSKLDLGAFSPGDAGPARRGYDPESGVRIAANAIVYATAADIPERADAPPVALPAGPVPAPEGPPAKPQLLAQRFAARKARIAADMAKLARELAEVSFQEYEQVTYPRALAAAERQVRQAQAGLERAEDRARWSRELQAKGFVPLNTKAAAGLTVDRARFDLEQAQTQRDVLTQSTRDKWLKTLRALIVRAEADRAKKEAAWERERAEEARLEARLDAR